jgi:LysM repeat protein
VATPPSKQVIKTPDTDTSAPVKTTVIGSVMPAAPTEKGYTVQKGDTLYNLSKRFNISIEDIKMLNNLTEEGIKIGQKLVLVK